MSLDKEASRGLDGIAPDRFACHTGRYVAGAGLASRAPMFTAHSGAGCAWSVAKAG